MAHNFLFFPKFKILHPLLEHICWTNFDGFDAIKYWLAPRWSLSTICYPNSWRQNTFCNL